MCLNNDKLLFALMQNLRMDNFGFIRKRHKGIKHCNPPLLLQMNDQFSKSP